MPSPVAKISLPTSLFGSLPEFRNPQIYYLHILELFLKVRELRGSAILLVFWKTYPKIFLNLLWWWTHTLHFHLWLSSQVTLYKLCCRPSYALKCAWFIEIAASRYRSSLSNLKFIFNTKTNGTHHTIIYALFVSFLFECVHFSWPPTGKSVI